MGSRLWPLLLMPVVDDDEEEADEEEPWPPVVVEEVLLVSLLLLVSRRVKQMSGRVPSSLASMDSARGVPHSLKASLRQKARLMLVLPQHQTG